MILITNMVEVCQNYRSIDQTLIDRILILSFLSDCGERVSIRLFSMILITNMVEVCQNYQSIDQTSIDRISILSLFVQLQWKSWILITNMVEVCQNYQSIDQKSIDRISSILSFFVRLRRKLAYGGFWWCFRRRFSMCASAPSQWSVQLHLQFKIHCCLSFSWAATARLRMLMRM